MLLANNLSLPIAARTLATTKSMRIYAAFLLVFFLSCCSSQAPSDDAITNGVLDLYSKTLDAFSGAAKTPYLKSKRPAFYLQARHILDVLELRAQVAATPKDQSIVKGILLLDHQYVLAESSDKTGWALVPSAREEAIQSALAGIRQQVMNVAYENAGKKAAAAIPGSAPPSTSPSKGS
jgi:hypothetical protein